MAPSLHPDVVTWDEVDAPDVPIWADRAFHHWSFLAEGDSWFTMGAIPTSNILFQMRFPKSAMIVNCAMPGDTIKHMATIATNRGLIRGLTKGAGAPWDAILLSGGGNDLIDDFPNLLVEPTERGGLKVNSPEDYFSEAQIAGLMQRIQRGYGRIVALRDGPDAPSKNVPMVCHTYDLPTANNSPSRFLGVGVVGPWLYRAYMAAQIPEEDWMEVTRYIFGRLADALLELDGAFPNFHVIDTRGLLTPAQPGSRGASGDWMNEIHPTDDGYVKIAVPMVAKVLSLIGG